MDKETRIAIIEAVGRIVGGFASCSKFFDPKTMDAAINKSFGFFVNHLPLLGHAPNSSVEDSVPSSTATSSTTHDSIHFDYLVCLEDGTHHKLLKRYLMTHFQLTPEQYRQKWKLPRDYPMTCEAYSEVRSKLAKKIKLGKRPRT